MSEESFQEYDGDLIALLEAVWGEGFMSPGGTDNVQPSAPCSTQLAPVLKNGSMVNTMPSLRRRRSRGLRRGT